MNPDRLSELRRQRALLAQHLAWLDSEITVETPLPPRSPPPQPAANVPPAPEYPSPSATFETYQANPSSVLQDTKRGCLVYLAVALLIAALALGAIYYFFYRDRPLLFVSSPPDSSRAISPAGKTSATPPAPPSSKDRRSDPSHR